MPNESRNVHKPNSKKMPVEIAKYVGRIIPEQLLVVLRKIMQGLGFYDHCIAGEAP